MSLADCLGKAHEILGTTDKERSATKKRLLDRETELRKNMSDEEAKQTVQNEFAKEYAAKLDTELQTLKKSIGIINHIPLEIKTRGNVEEINKSYEAKKQKQNKTSVNRNNGIFDELDKIENKRSEAGKESAFKKIEETYGGKAKQARFINDNFEDILKQLNLKNIC